MVTVPTDESANIGVASYIKFPFASAVVCQGWNASPYLTPGQLFFSVNPDSIFNKSDQMASAVSEASVTLSRGAIPFMGAQRWEDTVIASLPAGTIVKNESNYPWIVSDRAGGTATAKTMDADLAYSTWAKWIIARFAKYGSVAKDGGAIESDSQVRADGAISYHISPGCPIDCDDIPADLIPTHPGPITYGDLFAYQYGKVAKLTTVNGFAPSDYVDSNPYSADWADFNPRIVQVFAGTYSLAVPAGDVPTQAKWIIANAPNQWTDFACLLTARFFNAVAQEITRNAGRAALIYDQCGGFVEQRRSAGFDARLLTQSLDPKNYLAIWDCHVIQGDRGGPIAHHPLCELSGPVISAAYEPNVRNMANIEAFDNTYTQAIAQFYPSLSSTNQTTMGQRLIKHLWYNLAWAHICDRNGVTRRALCGASRDYWDGGTLTAVDPMQSLLTSIYPIRPWGPALYYSAAAMRAVEKERLTGTNANDWMLTGDNLAALLNSGKAPIGYYISDAALPALSSTSQYRPSAFLIPARSDLIPSSEMTALQAIAPVVTSPTDLDALSNKPIQFTGGLAGFAFIAQDGRLFIIIRNTSADFSAAAVSGKIKLAGLVPGNYAVAAADHPTSTFSLTVASDGTASFAWGPVASGDIRAVYLPASVVPTS